MTELSFDEFTKLALRTESKIDKANINFSQVKLLLDLFITVGTLLDYTKKGIFYNNYKKMDDNDLNLCNKIVDLATLLKRTTPSEFHREVCNDLDFRIVHGLLGAVTEASELAEHLQKYLCNGTVDTAGILEEFSDTDWYKAVIFDQLNVSESTGRTNVINKLRTRFPDAYSDENAQNRDLSAERKELEKNIV